MGSAGRGLDWGGGWGNEEDGLRGVGVGSDGVVGEVVVAIAVGVGAGERGTGAVECEAAAAEAVRATAAALGGRVGDEERKQTQQDDPPHGLNLVSKSVALRGWGFLAGWAALGVSVGCKVMPSPPKRYAGSGRRERCQVIQVPVSDEFRQPAKGSSQLLKMPISGRRALKRGMEFERDCKLVG